MTRGHRLFEAYGQVFPAGYQEHTSPAEACSTFAASSMLAEDVDRTVELYVPEDSEPGHLHF